MSAGTVPRGRRWSILVLAASLIAASLLTAGCDDDATAVDAVCGDAPRVVLEFPLHGRLEAGDPIFEDAYIDFYSLVVDRSTHLDVTLFSAELDPFLYLFDDSLRVLDQAFTADTAPTGTLRATTLHRAFAPGCYLIGASAWEPGRAGSYTVRVEPAEPTPSATDPATPPDPDSRSSPRY